MKQNLYSKNLLASLNKYVYQMQLLNKADNPKLVLATVLKWTQGQSLLTKKLLVYILYSEQKVLHGQEEKTVEGIIRSHLLKEFKKDDLTLAIRKLLYKKDLDIFRVQTDGLIPEREERYLIGLQEELGLSSEQCLAIRNQATVVDSPRIYHSPKISSISPAPPKIDESSLSFADNVSQSLAKHSDASLKRPQLASVNQRRLSQSNRVNTGTISQKIAQNKWTWLFLGVSIFFLFKGFDWIKTFKLDPLISPSVEEQKLCVDFNSRSSSRMSLGEKLLTPEQNNSQSPSKIDFYQGSAAFARCDFTTAQNKFQEYLDVDRNNPEALIYLNNAQAITQEHLKIAISVPLGSKPDIAWELMRGAAQAQADLNQQGGINQKPLLIQLVNDDNEPEIVRQVAQQLARDKNVLAVVGHNDSNSSLAAWQIYQREGLVMVSPTSTTTELSGVGSYILRTIPSVSALANSLAAYASVNSFTKNVVCFDSSDSASSSFAQAFIEESARNGGKIVDIKCDFAQDNFDANKIVERALTQNPDALLIAPSVNNMVPALSIVQANQQRLPLMGNHTLYTLDTLQEGGRRVAGMVLPSPWLPDATPNSKFSQSAMKYWGGNVNYRTAMAYDATETIIQGLKLSNSRSELMSVLTNPDFQVDGAAGKFGFERGDRLGEVQLAYVTKAAKNSKLYRFSKLNINDQINSSSNSSSSSSSTP